SVALLVLAAKRTSFSKALAGAAAFALPLGLAILWYLSQYGAIVPSVASSAAGAASSQGWLSAVEYLIFPFGIDLHRSFSQFFQHMTGVFPYYGLLLFASVAFAVVRMFRAARRQVTDWSYVSYVICFISIAVRLIIYYGSWEFSEGFSEDPTILGSSYFRYWLPIFVFSAPLIA